MNEFGDRVERVEKKVWVQLRSEGLQLCLRQPELSFLVFTKVVDRMADGDDGQ